MKPHAFLLFGIVSLLPAPAAASLNVFACEPEWGALAKELAGDKANVYVATTALQDPHRIEARPSLIARARNADLLVCTGAELEIGWLPLVQSQAANAKIQTGQPGYFEAARQVPLLEYIVDFYASQARLVVEVDGGYHAARAGAPLAAPASPSPRSPPRCWPCGCCGTGTGSRARCNARCPPPPAASS